jgi:hypothetical protein
MLGSMPQIAESDVFARLPECVQDAVLMCTSVLAPLDDQDQRTVVAMLIMAVKQDRLKPGGRRLN